ncbi:hypothetical protein [Calycomorphotria hydatis]|uniref:ATP-grasp domain-containing protein n=1 Tax=Calycomorphotria hydatis TaxID=2528027 RepID=A0A517TER7_9PLAN|nr:hypothetical protein [Calycomorphotria hydatis]QDT66866.1 hypothetical protein V22_41380 [Calycomorphotria hydatis]
MATLFVGNFDFEYRLALEATRGEEVACGDLPKSLVEINRRLADRWQPLMTAGDHAWLPGEDVAPGKYSRVVFWGWNTWAKRFAEKHRLQVSCPPVEVVRRINSRRFSFSLEQELSPQDIKIREITSLEELHDYIREFVNDESRWVVKAEYSNSARERILGQGSVLREEHVNWAATRLDSGQRLYLEPWLDRVAEVGFQFWSFPDQTVRLDGITELITAADGRFVESRRIHDAYEEKEWTPCVDTAVRAAETAAAEGYFGPLGIDAMQYIDEAGNTCFRPLQDINARYTMGRLALGKIV